VGRAIRRPQAAAAIAGAAGGPRSVFMPARSMWSDQGRAHFAGRKLVLPSWERSTEENAVQRLRCGNSGGRCGFPRVTCRHQRVPECRNRRLPGMVSGTPTGMAGGGPSDLLVVHHVVPIREHPRTRGCDRASRICIIDGSKGVGTGHPAQLWPSHGDPTLRNP
jgi:hypothetical protein